MRSISFGDTMVPIKVRFYPPFWGIVIYIRNIILLGSTTKKKATQMVRRWIISALESQDWQGDGQLYGKLENVGRYIFF